MAHGTCLRRGQQLFSLEICNKSINSFFIQLKLGKQNLGVWKFNDKIT